VKIAVFSTKNYDRDSLTAANSAHNHELCFFETQLDEHTAPLAKGIPVVCPFVNDVVNTAVLNILADQGTRLLALRSAGFNNVDLPVAAELGIAVVRVPAYSPYAVAEHTVALVLMLNRKLYRAYNRVRDDNFS
jgi:D-lactate dehydrogenase